MNREKIFRYWVEVRELASGSVRKLPLTAVRLVCLRRGKTNEPAVPARELLQLKDEAETWEVETFDELAARLRDKYPDAAFERSLHYVRDHGCGFRVMPATDSGACWVGPAARGPGLRDGGTRPTQGRFRCSAVSEALSRPSSIQKHRRKNGNC